MERTTFCLLFYIRRTKLNRNGEAPIMMAQRKFLVGKF